MRRYQDLEAWQKAMDLVVECYQATQPFPSNETYGLTSQIRRSAVSVPANIAEGHGRQHQTEFIQHLSIAYGSLSELETHIGIAQRLNYLDLDQVQKLLGRASEVGRLLNGLLRFLRKDTTDVRRPRTDNRLRARRPETGDRRPGTDGPETE